MAIRAHRQKLGGTASGKKAAGGWILVTVKVVGSAGPIRFAVSEEALVSSVIDTTLRCYGREGHLPILGSNPNDFLLYRAHSRPDALRPSEPIGFSGSRNFVLIKKQQQHMNLTVPKMAAGTAAADQERSHVEKKGGNRGRWKAWLNRSLTFKISFH